RLPRCYEPRREHQTLPSTWACAHGDSRRRGQYHRRTAQELAEEVHSRTPFIACAVSPTIGTWLITPLFFLRRELVHRRPAEVDAGRLLEGVGDREQFRLAVEPAGERDRERQFRLLRLAEAVGYHHGRMAGQVRQHLLLVPAADVEIDLGYDLLHLLHQQGADAVGPDVLDRRDQLARVEGAAPPLQPLRHTLAGQVVERGGALGVQDRGQRADGALRGELDRHELDADALEHFEVLLRRLPLPAS